MLFVPVHFHRGLSQGVAVSQTAGSIITTGSATTWSNTSAAFDGVSSQSSAVAAGSTGAVPNGQANFIGKDWGAGVKRLISGVTMIAANNSGFLGGPSAATWQFDGSNDGSAWIALDSGSTAGITGETITRTRSSINVTAAYRFHRVGIFGNGTNGVTMAELSFQEDVLK